MILHVHRKLHIFIMVLSVALLAAFYLGRISAFLSYIYITGVFSMPGSPCFILPDTYIDQRQRRIYHVTFFY